MDPTKVLLVAADAGLARLAADLLELGRDGAVRVVDPVAEEPHVALQAGTGASFGRSERVVRHGVPVVVCVDGEAGPHEAARWLAAGAEDVLGWSDLTPARLAAALVKARQRALRPTPVAVPPPWAPPWPAGGTLHAGIPASGALAAVAEA